MIRWTFFIALMVALVDGIPAETARAQTVQLPEQMVPSGQPVIVTPAPRVADPFSPAYSVPAGPVVWNPGQADPFSSQAWTWQWLPNEVIYRSYLAGVKEPRMAGVWMDDRRQGTLLDVTLGGRVGILRYGDRGINFPQGWELDIEGAAFPRVNLDHQWDLQSTDFRFGVPLTYGIGHYQTKFAFYHLSSHVADEFLLANPGFDRINYSRDALVWGHSYYVTDALRLYAEADWAFHADGGSKPWQFQFGVDFSPLDAWFYGGAPFFAVNGHLRQEVNYGGEFVVQTGWQWRGTNTAHLLRTGVQYFNGQTSQYEFSTRSDQQIGFGLWYDY